METQPIDTTDVIERCDAGRSYGTTVAWVSSQEALLIRNRKRLRVPGRDALQSPRQKDRKMASEVYVASTVLIVDDNAKLAYFTSVNVKQGLEDLNVVTAASCKEALALADEHHPAVCIVDLRLPDGDGLELIKDLSSRLPRMVPILVTAAPLPPNLKRGLFGTLTKPYDPEALIDLVRTALNSNGSWGGNPTASSVRAETRPPSSQHDFHHVFNRLSGLLTGIRALRLELHAAADDPSEVRRLIDEYTDRLSLMVKESAETLKRKADRG